MTRILQGNLNRCALAQNLLCQRVFKERIDACFICEQYLNLQDRAWFADKTGTAAIWIVNTKNVTTINSESGAGFVWIQTPITYFISIYLSPNEGISEFRQKLANIEDVITKFKGEVIIAGDLNAESAEWGADFSDTRGNDVANVVARLDLIVLNTGSITTFQRPGNQESILDISYYGKGPCDGVRGTLKQTAARASLQLPFDKQISNPQESYQWTVPPNNLPKIRIRYLTTADCEKATETLNIRYSKA
ncbi:uncharacterized protein LOC123258970 [Cotesia glomerata]|uniref:uncharacterized protein LOC123258970 n=1 Tax=Cotesia glomerata TaxID=32391 RepID=UPI001D0072ED|nr:uncharacterized protein LOC123258970 [Cotesia glomerata]